MRHYIHALATPLPESCELVNIVDLESKDVFATVALRYGSKYGEADALLSAVVEVASKDLRITTQAARQLIGVEVSTHGPVFAHPCDVGMVAEPCWQACRGAYVIDRRGAA